MLSKTHPMPASSAGLQHFERREVVAARGHAGHATSSACSRRGRHHPPAIILRFGQKFAEKRAGYRAFRNIPLSKTILRSNRDGRPAFAVPARDIKSQGYTWSAKNLRPSLKAASS